MHRLMLLLVPIGWLLARLPMSWLMSMGGGLGRMQRRLTPLRVRIAERNLSLCFDQLDESQRDQLLDSTLGDTGRGLMEMVLAVWASDRRLRRLYSVTGLEHYQQAIEGEQPVLIYSAHFTSVELACRLLNLSVSRPAAMVVRRQSNLSLEWMIDRSRRRHAGQTLEKKDLKGLMRTLRQQQPVIYGFDQHFTDQTVWSSLFGVPAATLSTAAKLAARSKAVVLSFWCYRDDDGHYHLSIDPAWADYPSGEAVLDADRYNHWIESRVRAHPSQYLWVHRRFRQPLPDGRSLYDDSVVRKKHRNP